MCPLAIAISGHFWSNIGPNFGPKIPIELPPPRATVFEVRDNQLVPNHQRHQRNVVSALGHFLSFATCMVQLGLWIPAYYFLSDGPLMNLRSLNTFLMPSFNFCVYPLIQTLFSENVRNSLFSLNWMRQGMRW